MTSVGLSRGTTSFELHSEGLTSSGIVTNDTKLPTGGMEAATLMNHEPDSEPSGEPTLGISSTKAESKYFHRPGK